MLDLRQNNARRFRSETLAPIERRMNMVVDGSTSNVDTGPDSSLRSVKSKQSFRYRTFIEVWGSTVGLVAEWNLAAITLDTVEISAIRDCGTLAVSAMAVRETWACRVCRRVSPASSATHQNAVYRGPRRWNASSIEPVGCSKRHGAKVRARDRRRTRSRRRGHSVPGPKRLAGALSFIGLLPGRLCNPVGGRSCELV